MVEEFRAYKLRVLTQALDWHKQEVTNLMVVIQFWQQQWSNVFVISDTYVMYCHFDKVIYYEMHQWQ